MITPSILAFGGLSAGQLLLIFLILLLVFGAKRLPEIARALGQAKKEFQKASREVSDELHKDEKPGDTASKSSAPTDDPTKKV